MDLRSVYDVCLETGYAHPLHHDDDDHDHDDEHDADMMMHVGLEKEDGSPYQMTCK